MKKRLLKIGLCIVSVLLFISNGQADEVCCCNITCFYETIFGASKEITVDYCLEIGFGEGKVFDCSEDSACMSAIEFGWIYTNDWTGSGCSLKESSDLCPAEYLLGPQSPELDILRQYRDEVLSKTPEGREIIRRYYKLSPAIIQAMEENEKVRELMQEMVDGLLLVLTDEGMA